MHEDDDTIHLDTWTLVPDVSDILPFLLQKLLKAKENQDHQQKKSRKQQGVSTQEYIKTRHAITQYLLAESANPGQADKAKTKALTMAKNFYTTMNPRDVIVKSFENRPLSLAYRYFHFWGGNGNMLKMNQKEIIDGLD